MPTCIALLRGVNVGGRRKVSMADLRELLGYLGFDNPRSLLQSGNLVFESRGSAKDVERRLEAGASSRLGLETDFLVRSTAEWKAVVSGNPFPGFAEDDPAHLLVMFLKKAPSVTALRAVEAAITGRERLAAGGRHLYLTYPDGIGRSRLTSEVMEKALETRGTARNWNTVLKLAAIACP